MFGLFKKKKDYKELYQKRCDEIEILCDEINMLHKKYKNQINCMQKKIEQLEKQPSKTVIKYVKERK